MFHTPSRPMRMGMFFSMGALRKCRSIERAPVADTTSRVNANLSR
jgi:hypothetical protein